MDSRQQLDLLSMYDQRAEPHMTLVPERDRFLSFHVVEPSGSAYSKGEAVVFTLRALDRTRYLGWVLYRLRLTWLVGAIYWLVAGNRGVLGRLVRDAPGPTRLRS